LFFGCSEQTDDWEDQEGSFVTRPEGDQMDFTRMVDALTKENQSLYDEWVKLTMLEIKSDKAHFDKCRKVLKKRWAYVAKMRKARKLKRGPREPIAIGTMNPQFTDGFGTHFTSLFKNVKNKQLRPLMNLYAAKLWNNGTMNWQRKFKNMGFLMKFMNRRPKKGFRAGVTDVPKHISTEEMPFHIFYHNLKEQQRKEIEEAMLKIGQKVVQDEVEDDTDDIFQTSEEIQGIQDIIHDDGEREIQNEVKKKLAQRARQSGGPK